MEAKYVLILDFTIGCLNIIELADEEIKASEEEEKERKLKFYLIF